MLPRIWRSAEVTILCTLLFGCGAGGDVDVPSSADEQEVTAKTNQSVTAGVPYQFIAKMYSEALGRAPDPSGWQANVNGFVANGCSQARLGNIAGTFYDSAEFKSKGYGPEGQVLTLYRGVLSRDPDASGFANYVGKIRAGMTAASVAVEMAGSTEFKNMVGAICAGSEYRTNWGRSQAIDTGGGVWSGDTLQACINSKTVCSVPQRTVVNVSKPIVIPAGHVLETAGRPARFDYAKMARLVRVAVPAGSPQTMVDLTGNGATLRNIWISGQRHLFVGSTSTAVVQSNVRHVSGTGNLVSNCRVEFPIRGTNFEVEGTGSLDVMDNLSVGYTSSHVPGGMVSPWADGVSFHAPRGTIARNDIIDPTDVGIVLFGHDGSTQAAEAYSNTIVHAGLSAYGSVGFDTLFNCHGCAFSGNGIHDNLIIAGRTQHSDIMLYVGTGPWSAPVACPGDKCGTGAVMRGNRTIWGDERQRVRVQHSIVVDGMLNANTTDNGLYIGPENLGACYVQNASGVRNDPGHASGNLMTQFWGPTHNCIGH